jgi:hypothetical protein
VVLISQHLNAAPPKLSDRRPELTNLDPVLAKALSKDPTYRFGLCRDFATELSERADFGAESDRPTKARITVAGTTPRSRKRRMRPAVLVAAAIAVVVFTVIGVIVSMIQPKIHPPSTPEGASVPAAPTPVPAPPASPRRPHRRRPIPCRRRALPRHRRWNRLSHLSLNRVPHMRLTHRRMAGSVTRAVDSAMSFPPGGWNPTPAT